MTTREQVKRLRDVGYEFNPACDLVYNPDGDLMLRRLYNPTFIHECQPCPSEKELMDWLAEKIKECCVGKTMGEWVVFSYKSEFDKKIYANNAHLTECLVQAVIAVMKGAK